MLIQTDNELNVLTKLMIAVSNCSLYTKEHEAFDDLARRAFDAINEAMEDRFEIMVIDNTLIVNKNPVKKSSIHKASVIKRLSRKHIDRIDIMKGVTFPEVRQLIVDLSNNQKGLRTYPHIVAGTVDVTEDGGSLASGRGSFASNHLDEIREIFHDAAKFKGPSISGVEKIAGYFVASLKREAGVLKLLKPVKSHDEYTYTHAANVGILSIFQAENLGIDEDLLHELGVAAMLHDAGKMFISREVLEKQGKLDEKEFAEIKKHPWYGAKYLAKMDNVTKLAPLVAFEHHMKFDGSGYPSTKISGRHQHILSQIVAIADFFDALRSNRPYREGMNVQEIIVLLRKCAGTDFNPFLVDRFIYNLQQAIAV